jgi:hypothetical protein
MRHMNKENMKQKIFFITLILLLTPPVYSISLSNYTVFPLGLPSPHGALSPVIADVDPNAAGYEIVVLHNAFSHGGSLRFNVYNSTGAINVSVSVSGGDAQFRPALAVADIDGNPANGLEIIFPQGVTSPYTLKAFYSNGTALWSIPLSGEVTAPAIADIDNDGSPDIVIGEGTNLRVYESDSTLKFNYLLGGSTTSVPALADFDGNGFLKIVAVNNNGKIFVINHDGTYNWSYPTGQPILNSAPAVGDIDNDGDLEIVAATTGGVYIVHHDGTPVSGWPPISSATDQPSPALGDIDGDDDLEIVVLGSDKNIYAWHHDGTDLFTRALPTSAPTSSPLLVDLDGDGRLETIIGYRNDDGGTHTKLSIIDYNGNILITSNLTGAFSLTTPAVGDIDEDGEPEIVVTTDGFSNGKIYVFTVTGGTYDITKTPWPMYHRDANNTGMHSPVARIISPSNGSSFNQAANVPFQGSGLSIDGNLTYEWYSSLDGNFLSGATMSTDTLSLGTHQVRLRVTDPNGRYDDSANISITITNSVPVAAITAPIAAVINPGEVINFTGTASDADGNITSYIWKANDSTISNGTVNSPNVYSSFNYSSLSTGTYTINFTVTDNDGGTKTAQKPLRINSIPTANITSPADGSTFNVGNTITFNGIGNDSDGNITAWYWTADGTPIGSAPSFSYNFSSAGTRTIKLIVTDSDGVNGSTSIDITIQSSGSPGNGDTSPGGGGGGAPPTTGGVSTVFDGKGVLTEPDFKEIIQFLRQDSGNKYSFTTETSPLVSVFGARGEVVLLEKLTSFLLSTIQGFENLLFKKEEPDIYKEAADYILEHTPGFTDLVVTRGDLHVDSLAVAPFAKLLGAPIILVKPNEIPSPDYNVLKKMNRRGRIYVIGGTEAVSASVEEELKQYASKVVRIGGTTRYETSVEIAKEMLKLTDSPLVISVSGKEPVLYAATLAGKYRAPIVFLDKPPIKESTFKEHSIIEGTLQIQSFDSTGLQVLSDKHPVASMNFALSNPDIADAWMYVRMRGYDTPSEIWIVRLNGKALAYNVHTEPVATFGTGQFVRVDVGDYLVKNGENTLIIEGTGFNVDDEFYLTGVTLAMAVKDPSKKTEYWIKEGFDAASYEDSQFGTPKEAKLYVMYLKSSETSSLYFNDERIHPATKNGNFFTLKEADVTSKVLDENTFESKSSSTDSTSPISILTVEADDLQVLQEKPEEKLDSHQEAVKNYISDKFDVVGLMYYQDTLEG